MPLSAEEQRRLAELEEYLSTDDPDFTRSFSQKASATRRPSPVANAVEQRRMRRVRVRRRKILLGSAMVLLGFAGVVGGVVIGSGLLAVAGFIVMAAAVGVLVPTDQDITLRGGGIRGGNRRIRGSRGRMQPNGGNRESNPDSFTARMEERWRRRQSR
ncbi:DUF3040 domain-containing protein [Cutibacterium sp.]|uniref:DUF3040 domain-containing protein n=1 Tax=Cutibacterium sp. TaxID=1912221 RepID=UPI0026DDB099|nr:DUF3040 domain-containing protein [Cutibacterium sp.]MDO4411628.1 DUF3040 domain-containing protein [Cutibacterium sp.]